MAHHFISQSRDCSPSDILAYPAGRLMGAHERTRVGREKARGPDPWLNGSALVFPRGQRERSTLANPRTDDALDTFVEYPPSQAGELYHQTNSKGRGEQDSRDGQEARQRRQLIVADGQLRRLHAKRRSSPDRSLPRVSVTVRQLGLAGLRLARFLNQAYKECPAQ
jgi:hypothetical protein